MLRESGASSTPRRLLGHPPARVMTVDERQWPYASIHKLNDLINRFETIIGDQWQKLCHLERRCSPVKNAHP